MNKFLSYTIFALWLCISNAGCALILNLSFSKAGFLYLEWYSIIGGVQMMFITLYSTYKILEKL